MLHTLLIDFHFFAYTVSLANALSELCDVTVMMPQFAGEQYQSKLNKRINLCLFHKPRIRNLKSIWTIYTIFKMINMSKPSVVHQISWDLWFNFFLPFFPNIPFVSTVHDARRHPGDKESIPLFWQQQWRRANQIIVHSENIKKELIKHDPAVSGKINIIPHGAYDFYAHWQDDQFVEKYPTILYFGRIWEYKGLRYLIEAEPLISQKIPGVKIVIAGYGESFEKYEKMMVNKENFTVHNFYIPDEMIAPLFQEASVVVLPYLEASQSGVLLIASAFGKPVVASAVGGIAEVMENGKDGFLVPPGDSRCLADAIVTMLKDNELRKQMGRAMLEKSKSVFSWPKIASQTLLVYKKAEDICAS